MRATATHAPPGGGGPPRSASPAIVAVVVVLAGCAGFGPPAPAEEPSRQPYTVEDRLPPNLTADTETARGPRPTYLSPGLSTAGIEDVSLLVDHHFAALERASGYDTYVFVRRSNTTVNGTLVRQRHTRYVVAYPDRWYESHARTANATGTTRYETWVNDSVALNRITRPNESVAYVAGSPTGPSGHPPYLVQRLTDTLSAPVLADANVTIEERARNDTTWYRLQWEWEHDTEVVRTLTVHLRADGLITRGSGTTIRDRASGETAVTRFHFQFTPDANVTLDRPAWYGAARNATTGGG